MSLELQDVSAVRGRTSVLKNCSLSIDDGEWVAVIGANGSGRSTLAEVLAGLRRPSQGRVLVDGHDVWQRGNQAYRRRVGLVMQRAEDQFLGRTVFDDVAYGLVNAADASDVEEEEIERRVSRALDSVGFELAEVRDRPPKGFSGGQRKRLALAAMLALEPTALVLDEPFAGLDAPSRMDLCELLLRLHSDRGLVIVTLTSNLDLVSGVTRMVLLVRGQIGLTGGLHDFIANQQLLREANVSLPERLQVALGLRKRGWDVPLLDSSGVLEQAVAREYHKRTEGAHGA